MKPYSQSYGVGLAAGVMAGGWLADAGLASEGSAGDGGAKRGEYEVRFSKITSFLTRMPSVQLIFSSSSNEGPLVLGIAGLVRGGANGDVPEKRRCPCRGIEDRTR